MATFAIVIIALPKLNVGMSKKKYRTTFTMDTTVEPTGKSNPKNIHTTIAINIPESKSGLEIG